VSAATEAVATAGSSATPTAWLQRVRADARRWTLALCLGYLALESVYIARLPLVMDEFQGAFAVERLSHEVPYRDFRPYKTVLGYYLQWPALKLAQALGFELWTNLLAVKLSMALATAGALAAAAQRLTRHFDPAAVVLGLAMLLSMSTFLERSAALRVDMLTGLLGLGSLLALLDRRALVAGLLTGLSFLVSQKGVYYALAGGAGLGLDWALGGPTRERFARGLRFAAAAALPVALYFAGFIGLLGGPGASTVGQGMVAGASRIAFEDFYAMGHFWVQTLVRNPGFYLALAGGLAVLFAQRCAAGARGERDRVLLGYSAALLALCIWHKQPWPYFFVLLLPTGFVLACRAFDEALRTLVPRGVSALRMALWAYVALGLLFPLSRIPTVLSRDSEVQRTTVALAADVLEPGDHYLGGLEFLYTHRQVPGLSWLDGPKLASLDAAGSEQLAALEMRFAAARPRLVIWNYRIARLPEPLLERIRSTHAPLFGNLLIYSPRLEGAERAVDLWFGGRYALSGPAGGAVAIDGQRLAVGGELRLTAGYHRVEAAPGYRLHLVPDDFEARVASIDPALARPQPLFVAPYAY
jgi:hypothetical protein